MTIIAVLLASLLSSAVAELPECNELDRKLLVVSLDGFRGDYWKEYRLIMPNLDSIADNVRAKYLKASFPSLTFPNHWTLVTGVYPETHGIVHNAFYDPDSTELFQKSSAEHFWNAVEPVWITAEKMGVPTAVCMWPGGTTPFKGVEPTKLYPKYNESMTFEQRVDWVFEGFLNESIKLGFLYFHEPDLTAHIHGPDSEDISITLRKVDRGIGYLLKQIKTYGLENCMDVIVLSDHGLTGINTKRVIALDELMENNPVEYFIDFHKIHIERDTQITSMTYSSVVNLWPYSNKTELLFQQLMYERQARYQKPPFDVYKKADVPDHFHYRNNARIAPIVMIARPGWQIVLYRKVFESTQLKENRGMHGYDNDYPDMRASFFAMGPSFHNNIVLAPFENVNVYSLLTHLAGIKPHPSNGTIVPFVPSIKAVPETFAVKEKSSDIGGTISCQLGLIAYSLIMCYILYL